MKKYLFLCLMAMGCLTFTACGSDDDEDLDDIEINEGDIKVGQAELKETSNQLILSWAISVQNIKVSVKWTCTFKDDICTKSLWEYTYPSETYAKAAYENAMQVKDEYDRTIYSYKGKVYTEDDTADYEGDSREEIKAEMEAMKIAIKEMYGR